MPESLYHGEKAFYNQHNANVIVSDLAHSENLDRSEKPDLNCFVPLQKWL